MAPIQSRIFVLSLLISSPAAAQIMTIGDEVYVPGGPGQKGRSIQTGTSVEVSMRGGTSGSRTSAHPGRSTAVRSATGGGGAGASAIGARPEPVADRPSSSRHIPLPDLEGSDASGLVVHMMDQRPALRLEIADRLGAITAPADRETARDALETLTGDGDPRVRVAAVRGLGQLKSPASRPTLVQIMHHGDGPEAMAALESLVASGPQPVRKELEWVAQRHEGPLADAAKAALRALDSETEGASPTPPTTSAAGAVEASSSPE